MFETKPHEGTREERYATALSQLKSLIDGEPDRVANLANASALLAQCLPDINWSGFYLYDGKELVLGPFQGLPACIRIPMGKGVCGTAAQTRETQRIDDVHAFPGHIACDAASNSEIVVPLVKNDRLIGVLDIDSPKHARFDGTDQTFVEEFAAVLVGQL
ncbi:GAF domain-containing protein [Saccharibacillus sp. CPCC 101409]|uniref:GAF domain-containing protein n=1 Tax=Saccharibacillus sp. CPCC 101409 TaxID=3058041 RepID=UPI002672FAFF|nr:GAF domain-containing protein [Saccharibacillus sp. CPCC 101409]MDO3412637.1 GAF domain-containing protein [Saccharibacillus sp. CPCC 101409]